MTHIYTRQARLPNGKTAGIEKLIDPRFRILP